MVKYTDEIPDKEKLYELYDSLEWNEFLQLNAAQLFIAMKQSWYSIYAYEDDKLVGTGRVISDGVINALLCGLGVHPDYRDSGIGTEISRLLVERCHNSKLHIQFFCKEELVSFYEKMGFTKFAVGMKR